MTDTTIRALAALALAGTLATAPATAADGHTPGVREVAQATDAAMPGMDHGTDHAATADPAATGGAAVGDIVVEAAWTRQSPPGARAGGGYARITNAGAEADVLLGGSVPFAERLEVHEMAVKGGVMTMRELDGGLRIEPGETVEMGAGGLHLMFLDVTEPPVAGGSVPVTLRFERAGEVTLDLPVAAIGATSPGGAMGAAGMDHGGMNYGGMDHGATGGEPSADAGTSTN